VAKVHSKYVCQQCGFSQVGWAGKCPECGTWGSMVETLSPQYTGHRAKGKGIQTGIKPINLSKVPLKSSKRISTKISEFDRVLGGGIVPGQVILLAGDPGVGKSTLLLQIAQKLGKVLYVAGEESMAQIRLRAKRIGVSPQALSVLEVLNVDTAIGTASEYRGDFKIMMVDSIQTITTDDLSGVSGSVGQVRECASRLAAFAKSSNIPVILVGHATKSGTVAGPNTLSHIVDTVFWFEGDINRGLRILRSVKNRFGPTDEIGIFEMGEGGLAPVTDASKLFIGKARNAPGSMVAVLMEGTRPVLVEIQALVAKSKMAFPKRVVQGVDLRRVELILAVLQRRAGIPLYEYDVFVNVLGGIKVSDPAADLAIALSIAGSFFDKPMPTNLAAIGEIGLLGEIRKVSSHEKRVKEAKSQGYKNITSEEISLNRLIHNLFSSSKRAANRD